MSADLVSGVVRLKGNGDGDQFGPQPACRRRLDPYNTIATPVRASSPPGDVDGAVRDLECLSRRKSD
jgi:hypothetical protein